MNGGGGEGGGSLPLLFCKSVYFNWFLHLMFVVFDEFDCVFIDNGQDLQYKKLNWFSGVSKVSFFLG